MSSSVTADPAQLALLRTALNEHCTEFSIEANQTSLRSSIAGRILCLFENGVGSLEEMKLVLKEDRCL